MLSELIFGKKLVEITFDDLQAFFQEEQEETSLLEFKSGGVLVDDIYKEVCAFLNTEGGVIIIGAPREEKRKPTPKTDITICKGELTPSNFRGKDWLMTSIVSNISPPPTNIKIQEFHSEEGSYFIVEVPQSMTPPHQSNRDSRYYIRMEREAKPAPHGVVEALFSKRQKPKLKISGDISKLKDNKGYELNISVGNESQYPTEKMSYVIHLINISLVPYDRIEGKHTISKTEEGTFVINFLSEMVLWRGLDVRSTYSIIPKKEPFIYSIMAWSRDAEIVTIRGIYDPAKNAILENENSQTDEIKGVNHLLRRLEELKSEEKM